MKYPKVTVTLGNNLSIDWSPYIEHWDTHPDTISKILNLISKKNIISWRPY
jgi:hypothetical protein